MGHDLQGKSVAVAGAGGIGDAIAAHAAAAGARVLLGDLDADRAEHAAAAIRAAGGDCAGMALDGAEEGSVAAFFARAQAEFGGLDGCVVNFASFKDAGSPHDVVDVPLEDFDEVMRVNARGFVLCTRKAIPLLRARGGGALVYMSSGAAHSPAPNRVAYAMSKSAIHALMRHVAVRFGPEGIRANAIAPGYIVHDRLRQSARPGLLDRAMERNALKTRPGNEHDIAAMTTLLLSEQGAFVTGQVIAVDGGSSMRP